MITFDLVKKEFKHTDWQSIPKGSLMFICSTNGVWRNNGIKPIQSYPIKVR